MNERKRSETIDRHTAATMKPRSFRTLEFELTALREERDYVVRNYSDEKKRAEQAEAELKRYKSAKMPDTSGFDSAVRAADLWAARKSLDRLKAYCARLKVEGEQSRARLAKARKALTIAYGALVELFPCAAEDCKQEQSEWLEIATRLVDSARREEGDL